LAALALDGGASALICRQVEFVRRGAARFAEFSTSSGGSSILISFWGGSQGQRASRSPLASFSPRLRRSRTVGGARARSAALAQVGGARARSAALAQVGGARARSAALARLFVGRLSA
jgi:hypothetical protein